MQVTNSTGRNTDYRVGAGGGTNVSFASSGTASMLLEPAGGQELFASSWPCKVEFWVDGTLVASQSFPEDPGQVALLESEGQFRIEVTPYPADDGSVAV